jgi:hypothetical protein
LIAISRHLFASSALMAAAGDAAQVTMISADRIGADRASEKSFMNDLQ